MTTLHFFAVYSGRPKARGHLCIARTAGPREAVKAARNLGLTMTRNAYARKLSLCEYAGILESAGLDVRGVERQTEMVS